MNVSAAAAVGLTVATLIAVAAVGSDPVSRAQQPAEQSGIQIATFIGPVNCRGPRLPGRREQCLQAPVRGRVRVTSLDRAAPARTTTTGRDGRGRMVLEPGRYSVRALPIGRRLQVAPKEPRSVTVFPGEISDVIIDYPAS